MGRILALDYGTTRIGVAISDALRITAQPLAVVPSEEFEERLRELTKDRDIDLVVVGLPTSLDGSEGPSAAGARRLAERAGAITGVSVEMVDERFTTTAAERVLIEGNVRRRRRKEVVDKVAAAVILQGYLETLR
ncbi:MAG: Holliday junction resolvase RuvX [Gammaproteobacteria bacterium]|nr:Holliday junction resolvase RuvX [Gammaproteobacteria bacterium]